MFRAKRKHFRAMTLGGSLLGLSLLLLPATLLAQGIESLQLPPSVMIVVDSSGSMDWRIDGTKGIVCAGGVDNDGDPKNDNSCSTLPAAGAKYDAGAMPSAANQAAWSTKSRYILAREALSGTYDPAKYFCCYRGGIVDTPIATPQLEDGIMDLNSGTARFGLATFESNSSVATDSSGGFSYGDEGGTNVGIKNENATDGKLVSVGMSNTAAEMLATNAVIQTVIEASLPNGSTPTAPALYDLGYYYENHADSVNDPYKACRSKNIILLTDGEPTSYTDKGYLTPAGQAAVLLTKGIKTYVVGFNTSSTSSDTMKGIAFAGGTCEDLTDPYCFYTASTGEDLKFVVNTILSDIMGGKGARTKTASTTRTSFRADRVGLYEVSASFAIIPGSTFWEGHLERVTYECDGSGDLVPQPNPLDYAAKLAEMVATNNGAARRVYTSTADPAIDPRPITPADGLQFVSILDPNAGQDYDGEDGLDPFSEDCATGTDDDLILVQATNAAGKKIKFYKFVGTGYSLKPYQCGFAADGVTPVDQATADTQCNNVNQFCYFGKCHVKGTACTIPTTMEDCCNATADLNKKDVCTKTCFRDYCSAVHIPKSKPECTKHSQCTSEQFPVCHLGKCVQGLVDACSPGELIPERGLGDILHSNPAIVGGPELDLPFPKYAEFRRTYGQRDTMLYVGGNDGMLHAFLTGALAEGSLVADEGKEIFAFIPKEIHSKLRSSIKGHLVLFDGSPLIKDVRLYRNATEEKWATVLVSGLRGGGHSYFALDVTDPLRYATVDNLTAPTGDTILWEVTQSSVSNGTCPTDVPQCCADCGFERLGLTYGQAAMGSVYLYDSGSDKSSERAIAVLPGGMPDISPLHDIGGNVIEGHVIYVVDLATGAILREFTELADGTALAGAVTGTPAVFNPNLGALASRAFVGDELGRLLRINMTGGDPAAWSVEVFFDPASHVAAGDVDSIEAIYAAPAVSLNESGQLVVVFGNGDVDNLEPSAHKSAYMASVSEVLQIDVDGNLSIVPELNWFDNFATAGEKLTGDPVIFNKVAYYPTFMPGDGTCNLGHARIYGAHYKEDNGGGGPKAVVDLKLDENADKDLYVDFGGSTLVFGVDVAARPSCVQTSTDGSGVVHYSSSSHNEPQLIVQTGSDPFDDMENPPSTTGTAAAPEIANKVRIDLPKPPNALKVLSWSAIYD